MTEIDFETPSKLKEFAEEFLLQEEPTYSNYVEKKNAQIENDKKLELYLPYLQNIEFGDLHIGENDYNNSVLYTYNKLLG